MSSKTIFFISLILLLSLIITDTFFKIYSVYYFYTNIDIFMHFIGGFSILTFSIAVLRNMNIDNKFNLFLFILLFSIFWEYIEYIAGNNVLINKSFWIDTVVDLLMNALGGIMAYICFYKICKTKK